MNKINVSQFTKIKIHRLNKNKNNIGIMSKMLNLISEKMNNYIKYDKFYYFSQFSLIGVICSCVYILIDSIIKGVLF